MTDYETFAGIFTCQKLAFAHRQSATLLSRTKELDKMFVDKVSNQSETISLDLVSFINNGFFVFLLLIDGNLDAHSARFVQC